MLRACTRLGAPRLHSIEFRTCVQQGRQTKGYSMLAVENLYEGVGSILPF
jgi:hypothetical protein